MKLTASIVTYRTSPDEVSCVLELLERSCAERVYVVDNARDDCIKQLCSVSGKTVYIPSDNMGYGAGHNQALRRAMAEGSEFHLVMNSDISFDSLSLDILISYMEANPHAGCVQPRIVNTRGELQYTVRRLPTPIDLIGRRFLPRFMLRGRLDNHEMRSVDHGSEFNAPFHQGSFMFLRMSVLKEVGLFDERFFLYGEDIDLTRRIHERYLTMYVPFMTVVHRHRRASYHSLPMLAIHCVSMIRYFNKWGWRKNQK